MVSTEVGQLYGAAATRLEQLVRLDVRARDAVIEDACQMAWTRLVDHGARVRRETALQWLVTTAVREAFRLARHDQRELSLEDTCAGFETTPGAPPPEELVVLREQLAAIETLPVRQQRLLWLQALGLTYDEMAEHEGCTRRTVERQLLRAKHRARSGWQPLSAQ